MYQSSYEYVSMHFFINHGVKPRRSGRGGCQKNYEGLMEIKRGECVIRPVAVGDLDQLFTMLIDLAQHEGLAELFKLTRERLEDGLFGINADWNCLVAADPYQKLIGFCLYSFANTNRVYNLGPMIQVDDLYIAPEYRNAKIGYKLIHQLALIAKRKNITRFDIWCVKDNEQGQKFYQKIGAERLDFIDVYVVDVTQFLADAAPS